ncbi:MAG: tRNA (adenosine(37)-N6)-dimethylallyltransferase MiaA [Desulfofustis sp.]|nr:tRNA (adenosine(37)-N6)-dimethylallyltransferase MiaA [Desulfofustis sp.]
MPVVALVGPTAIGKTELSLGLARKFNCEIVSVDSMQVYRYMDIGTAKASVHEQQMVPHHLIDIVDPDDDYNAARFVSDCLDAINDIHSRGATPLLTGGTGLYFQALRQGLFPSPHIDRSIRETLRQRIAEEGSLSLHEELQQHDPSSAARIHPHDTTRILRSLEVLHSTGVTLSEHLRRQRENAGVGRFKRYISIGITCERETLYQRINHRTSQLFEQGLEKEVLGLINRGFGPELKSMQAIGYRHMVNYLEGRWSLAVCRDTLARDTRRYAKRQYTWFNRDESITWFDKDDAGDIFSYVEQSLADRNPL